MNMLFRWIVNRNKIRPPFIMTFSDPPGDIIPDCSQAVVLNLANCTFEHTFLDDCKSGRSYNTLTLQARFIKEFRNALMSI